MSRERAFAFIIARRSSGTNNPFSITVEFATVGKTESGKVYHHLWSAEEIQSLLREHGLAKEETDD